MADSIREKIGLEIESKLETITVANGYNIDSGINSHRATRNFNEDELPAITFWLGTETSSREYHNITRTMIVDVESFAPMDDAEPDDSLSNMLIADIQTCMETNDPALSDLIEGMEETNTEPIYPGDGSDIISVRVSYEISYKTVKGNPYLQP